MPLANDLMVRALQGQQAPPDQAGARNMVMSLSKGGNGGTRTFQLIRHGATKLNNDDVSVDRIRGWSNVPLSEDGREEATKLGKKLAKDPPEGIFSSDLDRAHETAQIISKITGAPIVGVSQHFRPWNVGEYSGQITSKAIPILAKYAKEAPDEAIPGGEPFNVFRDRFLSGLKGVLNSYPGKLAVVTHHRGERLVHAWGKAGYPENGDIDVNEFNQKGEHTGAINEVKIPVAKLNGKGPV